MNDLIIQERLNQIHTQLNKHKQVKGSLLVTDKGVHISSSLNQEETEVKQLSDGIGYLFRYLNNITEIEELSFKLRGINVHLKHIPSKNMILTVMASQQITRNIRNLANMYARVVQDII